jgi:predicted acetyltransferase
MAAMRKTENSSDRPAVGSLASQNKKEPAAGILRGSHGSFGGSACLRDLGGNTKIVVGNVGDHPLVLKLLVQLYQSSLAEDFQSRLDEPSYEPCDRLLLTRTGQLLGQVQVSKHIGWFQQQRIPLVNLQDFVTLPEFRPARYDEALLETAEAMALQEGAILGIVRTDRPEWFEQQGWSCCRAQGHTRANTRAILSHFDARPTSARRKRSSIEVRSWRHFELDSLRSVYHQLATNMWAALQRSESTWQWLVGRKAQDQILIAVKSGRGRPGGQSLGAHAGDDTHGVGYAVVRDSCIVEMMTLPGYSATRPMMMARACRDAIDRGHHFVSLHTPATDPLHELLVTAGGNWLSDNAATGGVWMLKLLDPERWVERFYPILHQRAREAGIGGSQELDFAVGDADYRLTLTRRSSRLVPIPRRQPDVHCDWRTFQDLLMSNLISADAVADNRLRADDTNVLRTLAALFPSKLFWQSPFELLRL